jgi:hypothetical protein
MSAILHKYDRCFAGLFASACSLVVWFLVGELRWIDPPWHYKMSASDSQVVFGTMYWLDVSSKALGFIAVIWAVAGFWKTRTLFSKIILTIVVLVFLISFVP